MCINEREGEIQRRAQEKKQAIEENFGISRLGKVRTFLWNMTEYPETGRAAQVIWFSRNVSQQSI